MLKEKIIIISFLEKLGLRGLAGYSEVFGITPRIFSIHAGIVVKIVELDRICDSSEIEPLGLFFILSTLEGSEE